MFETKKTRTADPKEVRFCRLCGTEIVQLSHANGHLYWTDVRFEPRNHSRYVILGEGNHYNFKPEHNCVSRAENDLRIAESNYAEFIAKHTTTKTTLDQMNQADKELAERHTDDQQLLDTLKRLHDQTEANFKVLDAQKEAQDTAIAALRSRCELLRQGKSVIAADKPAIGRIAKVVKGRKVPVGTQGMIFWVGLDQYKEDGIRVGIEANGQKHYTDAANIEIIKS